MVPGIVLKSNLSPSGASGAPLSSSVLFVSLCKVIVRHHRRHEIFDSTVGGRSVCVQWILEIFANRCVPAHEHNTAKLRPLGPRLTACIPHVNRMRTLALVCSHRVRKLRLVAGSTMRRQHKNWCVQKFLSLLPCRCFRRLARPRCVAEPGQVFWVKIETARVSHMWLKGFCLISSFSWCRKRHNRLRARFRRKSGRFHEYAENSNTIRMIYFSCIMFTCSILNFPHRALPYGCERPAHLLTFRARAHRNQRPDRLIAAVE